MKTVMPFDPSTMLNKLNSLPFGSTEKYELEQELRNLYGEDFIFFLNLEAGNVASQRKQEVESFIDEVNNHTQKVSELMQSIDTSLEEWKRKIKHNPEFNTQVEETLLAEFNQALLERQDEITNIVRKNGVLPVNINGKMIA